MVGKWLGSLVALLLVVSTTLATDARAQSWGTIRGKVLWTGEKLPEQCPLEITRDRQWCETARVAAGLGPILDETLVVQPATKAIANVLVYVKFAGAPVIHAEYPQTRKEVAAADAKAFERIYGFKQEELPSALASKRFDIEDLIKLDKSDEYKKLRSDYCQFVPHFLAVREGQKVLAVNTEPVFHNYEITSVSGNSSCLNTPPGTYLIYNWPVEPTPLIIQCNLHGWMEMYAMVFDHPYFAVTDDTGTFELKNVPAGEVELVFRNPKFFLGGRNKYTLALAADEVVNLDVGYDGNTGTAVKK